MATKKLSDKEKKILEYIIINCEIYGFSEDEALKYIKDNFSQPISRRTYYLYKQKILKEHEENSWPIMLLKTRGSKYTTNLTIKSLRNTSLMHQRDDIFEEGLRNNIDSEEFDKVDNSRLFLQKLHERTAMIVETTKNIVDRVQTERKIADNKYSSIPDNAIIRKEYVKCGKYKCLRCKHGPYYYAYWKDEKSGKLTKKYLGTSNPRKEVDKNGL